MQNNVNEFHKQNVEESETPEYILYDSTYIKYKINN